MDNGAVHLAAEIANYECLAMLVGHSSFQDVNIRNRVSALSIYMYL